MDITATDITRRQYVLAGKATFTLQSGHTGTHFTYRVLKGKARAGQNPADVPHFVYVLTGPDNTSNYQFLGTIFEGEKFRHGVSSSISAEAPSAKGFAWFWRNVDRALSSNHGTFLRSNKCCRCGRALTTPESVLAGIGPECSGRARRQRDPIAARIADDNKMDRMILGGSARSVSDHGNQPYGKIINELLHQHPITHTAWHYDVQTDQFMIEDSMFNEHTIPYDPWGFATPRSTWLAHRNREEEITHWTANVTVYGVHVELTIIND